MRYSLDTSALLDGWRRYYPPDVFPALWQGLEALIENGELRATEEVREELEKKDDEVLAWVQERPALFVEFDEAIQTAVQEILRRFPKLVDTRTSRNRADPFVIALAQVHGGVVVTGERAPGTDDRPTIPFVCRRLDLDCVALLDVVREQGWSF